MALSYDYYPLVLSAINLLGQGNTVTHACDRAGISYPTFMSYVNSNPDLLAFYQDAQQRSWDAMADALVNIDNHATLGRSDPKMAKVISDNMKWLLERKKPKEYGARVQVDVSVGIDAIITSALNAARARVALPDNSDVIDAVVLPAPEDEDAQILRALFAN